MKITTSEDLVPNTDFIINEALKSINNTREQK